LILRQPELEQKNTSSSSSSRAFQVSHICLKKNWEKKKKEKRRRRRRRRKEWHSQELWINARLVIRLSMWLI
jgi:hypothetical protein